MQFEQKFGLVKALAFVVMFITLCDGDSVVRYMSVVEETGYAVEDTGYATNCGKTPFKLSWSPKVLSARHAVTISVEYTTIYELAGGSYNLSLTEYGEQEPFLVYANPFTCDDLKGVIACPIPKGITIRKTQVIDQTKYLLSFPGRYTLIAEVKNQDGHEMFCAKMDITIDNNK